MAGMEELEIHSKSYLVRWVHVHAGHTISWSVKPDRKSINFGIFKYPKSESGPTTTFPTSDTYEPPLTPGLRPDDLSREPQPSRNAQSTATEKLKNFGLQPVLWYGACEANRVSMGKYDVPQDSGGMYALVFDNTFSKQLSKKATFVLLTFPTNAAPQSTHHTHHIQSALQSQEGSLASTGISSQGSISNLQSSLDATRKTSPEKVEKYADETRVRGQRHEINRDARKASFHTGVLQKRRRKKHQGWARRFFSLDPNTGTLSYYHDRSTLALRGAVPLSVAVIGANAKTKQISIDSGAEIWHLKASSQKDFEAWKRVLEQAKQRNGDGSSALALYPNLIQSGTTTRGGDLLDPSKWSRVELLVGVLERSREAARTLAKDTDPKYLPLGYTKPITLDNNDSNAISRVSSNSGSPTDRTVNGYFGSETTAESRLSFWKRKPSSDRSMPGMFKRSASATPSTIPQKSNPPTPGLPASSSMPESHPGEGIHDNCMSLLKDLDFVVSDLNQLILENKKRRGLVESSLMSRYSTDSAGDDEFFDAEGYHNSQLLDIQHESDEQSDAEPKSEDDHAGSDSEYEEFDSKRDPRARKNEEEAGFPAKPTSLTPLPATTVMRRSTLPCSIMQPPSLIGFLRKNVGKDLSTIAMPVSANEPISLLQRASEVLEYSKLLDTASDISLPSIKRLGFIACFAISALSSSRVKERSIRKPFNPMLGETFELVREDRGFRFIGEKVTHRPVRIACQADAERWSLSHSPAPTQKFWGKSAEIITEDKYRVVLHTTGDHFSWTPATSFLRNILAGEKYIEPVGNMTIVNSSTGEKAVITFKSGGMFSGRSEDVTVQLFNNQGAEEATGLSGRWTTSLHLTESGSIRANAEPLWTVGDLVQDSAKRYGFTTFAASLNEITAMEEAKLPPTDSRLRPDQRAAESGALERAESVKTKLEEAQRCRRKMLEDRGIEYQPQWFEKVQNDEESQEIWVLKGRTENYWTRRELGNWDGVANIFEHS